MDAGGVYAGIQRELESAGNGGNTVPLFVITLQQEHESV